MKKSSLLLLILSLTVFTSDVYSQIPNNNVLKKPNSELSVSSSLSLADSIPSSRANEMIAHYLDKKLVDHSLDEIIKQISLYNTDLYLIFKIFPNTTRIRLLTAAYLNNDSVPKDLRNKVTVLVQLKVGYNSNYYFYDIKSFGDGRICPPPLGCSTY